jgi:hypothetical protein
MKNVTVIFSVIILIINTLYISNIQAIRAYPYPVTITQPDGSELTIRMRGDEFFKYRTTEDGFLIKRNDKDFILMPL